MKNETTGDFSARRDGLRRSCARAKADGFLTFDFSDVFYLSGFPSEGCFLFTGESGDWIFAPKLLAEQVRSAVRSDRKLAVVDEPDLLGALRGILKTGALRRIGYDPDKMTVGLLRTLERFSGVKWVPLGRLVLNQRVVKDEHEIALISRACGITARSAKECLGSLRPGRTEEEVAADLDGIFRKNGSGKRAFETIVAFGGNAAYPHHVVTAAGLARNSAVLLDAGCAVGGYRSDLTRTVFFGKITRKFRTIYGIVHEAQRAGVAKIGPGVPAKAIDSACREVIRKSGYGEYFIHGTGHGVGLDIHEPPRLGKSSKDILRAGMVVTVEPGIYLPGEFGVRIEDTMLVTPSGHRILTR
ncbi:MAG: hypothetical protein A2636_03185 [Elusimicrobia bacterium RIFCSPHIGHO2_01_FULL_64_10]|nr:MAG: hypothetical protein A2636_03185 [Elusimicrobia bacterium RIFCSPHIGHO2_01_FULL_64_10]